MSRFRLQVPLVALLATAPMFALGVDGTALADLIGQANRRVMPVIGTSTVVRTDAGTPPVTNTAATKAMVLQGKYLWYNSSRDWIVKATYEDSKPGLFSGRRTKIACNANENVLTYELFYDESQKPSQQENGHFLVGHLDQDWEFAYAGSGMGRVWKKGTIQDLVTQLEDLQVGRQGALVVITGTYKGGDVEINLDSKKGYLATYFNRTKAQKRGGEVKVGFEITDTQYAGGAWYAKKANAWQGLYRSGNMTDGTSFEISYGDLAPAKEGDWPFEMQRVPAGGVIGSDQSKLYRANQDGQLEYWGEQGRRIQKSTIGWGTVFIASGSLLLLGCMWHLFLKRGTR